MMSRTINIVLATVLLCSCSVRGEMSSPLVKLQSSDHTLTKTSGYTKHGWGVRRKHHFTKNKSLRKVYELRGGGSWNGHVEQEVVMNPNNEGTSYLKRNGDDLLRGGDTNKSLVIYPEQQQQQQHGTIEVLQDKVETMKRTAKSIKRKEFLALLGLRVAFVLLFPFAIIGFVLTLGVSILLLAFRILTLNFCFRDVSKISFALLRATISLLLACVTGVISPLFATFGLLAALSVAILEMAEPILRIRYARQMKKLAHLHKLITDPVLMETMGVVIKGASALSAAAADVGQQAGPKVKRGFYGAKKSVKNTSVATTELVENLLNSSGAIRAKETIENKLPQAVVSWGKDQLESLRKSGALEAAATRALTALQKDLSGAVAFMPYLEAIENVRQKQEMEKQKRKN